MLEVIECKCIEVVLDEICQQITLVTTDKNLSKSGIMIYAPIKMSMSRESKLYGNIKPKDLITLTVDLKPKELETNQKELGEWYEEKPSWQEGTKIDLDK